MPCAKIIVGLGLAQLLIVRIERKKFMTPGFTALTFSNPSELRNSAF